MNASDRRALKLLTQSKGDVRASLLSFLSKPKHYKKPIQKAREAKEQKERLSRMGATAAIREACVRRAAGLCEACWTPFAVANPAEMDHWLGGNGRRRQKQAIENCWMLHMTCHQRRQRGQPDAEYWNRRFHQHAAYYGYPFTPHIEHATVVRKSSRASGLGSGSPLPIASDPDARDLPIEKQRSESP